MSKSKKQHGGLSRIFKGKYRRDLFLQLLVVFLGVMAAFMLNSWKTERENSRLEQKYLNDLFRDVNEDIEMLEKAIKKDSVWIELMKPKLILLRDGTLSTDTANALVKRISFISGLDFNTGTYENIINSGKLNIIKDFKLRKRIVDYHISISEVKFIEEHFNRYFNDFVMPFIISHYSILQEKITEPEICKTNRFANIITGYFSMLQQQEAAYERLLKRSYKLKNLLEDRLKK